MEDGEMSRKAVIRSLAEDAVSGNLGLFVGAGFAKALVGQQAPSWIELLKRIAEDLEVEFPTAEKALGWGCPGIATHLVGLRAEILKKTPGNEGLSDAERISKALRVVKSAVARLCSFAADDGELKERFTASFKAIEPSWFVTTNYDTLLEELLDKPNMLLPTDTVPWARGLTNVFHLHGHRLDPDSIILTEQDYAPLTHPTQYRHSKLSLMLAESTTLFIGYGLGDSNVQAAVMAAKDFRRTEVKHVSLLFMPQPREDPYFQDSLCVLEVADLADALAEIAAEADSIRQAREATAREAEMTLRMTDEEIACESDWLARLAAIPGYGVTNGNLETLTFLGRAFAVLWAKTEPYGAFSYYENILRLIVAILRTWPDPTTGPAVVALAANQFVAVASYVGKEPGQSWAARGFWDSEEGRKSISQAASVELTQRVGPRSSVAKKLLEHTIMLGVVNASPTVYGVDVTRGR